MMNARNRFAKFQATAQIFAIGLTSLLLTPPVIAETVEDYTAKVRGTVMDISLVRPLPAFVEIRLDKGFRNVDPKELQGRMQVAMNMLTDCNFEPSRIESSGRKFKLYVDNKCWYYPLLDARGR
ncbi:hypothetical protein [Actibacterium pelagium]|uniref:Uncharacterized protein n=1 Tax=Actibacterium pelagium TaxID=2029103 RepID=A0A917EPI9_9RHOB|nr:hypothetical protein [Actibacterium pelagium]GGE62830.1 hypothetical protein GCM10011517_33200 [Actibacterium pelagium]